MAANEQREAAIEKMAVAMCEIGAVEWEVQEDHRKEHFRKMAAAGFDAVAGKPEWPDPMAGYCPMGCGQTLFVGAGGYITCSYISCPNPCAVDELLSDGDARHLVKIGEKSFNIQHPLRERLNGTMFDCGLHEKLKAMSGPPMPLGLYRVAIADDGRIAGWETAVRTDPPTQ